MINYISLGAGVQSSTMLLMAHKGIICPKPDFAVFADTMAEPTTVYKWLAYLQSVSSIPIYITSLVNLEEESLKLRKSANGNNYAKLAIPAFIIDEANNRGIMMRQCTLGAKIRAINRFVKQRIGRNGKAVEWMGISVDEISRMKDSRDAWKVKRYSLIEMNMTRNDCLRWMNDNKYPTPPRSSCVFCPYHSDDEWLWLKNNEPESFKRAVEYEKKYQQLYKKVRNFRGTPYLHKSLKPLEDVNFEKQSDLFDNECGGYCGV